MSVPSGSVSTTAPSAYWAPLAKKPTWATWTIGVIVTRRMSSGTTSSNSNSQRFGYQVSVTA